MRLIMRVNYSDDCTYSFTETYPFECESIEKAMADFKKLVTKHFNNYKNFMFCGVEFHHQSCSTRVNGKLAIKYPEILTVDEWFEKYTRKSA